MMDLLDQVIEILKRSDQTLVFLDSQICPVRSVVPESDYDEVMKELITKLKYHGVIEKAMGFISMSRRPPFFYATSFILTEGFFRQYGPKKYVQLKLF